MASRHSYEAYSELRHAFRTLQQVATLLALHRTRSATEQVFRTNRRTNKRNKTKGVEGVKIASSRTRLAIDVLWVVLRESKPALTTWGAEGVEMISYYRRGRYSGRGQLEGLVVLY